MRLIDADDLKKSLNYIYDCGYIGSKSKEGIASDIIETIDNAPTVTPDMAQVLAYECGKASAERHGKWIYDGAYENFPIDGDIYHCSICKRTIATTLTRPTELFPFCHCGARMEAEDENSN